ncbi:MAG: insulinase family protein [Propionibacteriaceae bacterium]|jgi:predicted Zn-dependent peptidase|nr:insulinase family protein [Propionibacteriaceae bacterium]
MASKRPKVKPPREWRLGSPRRARLDNGLGVSVFERPGQHIVSASLVLDLPLSEEPPDREGVGELTQRCCGEGTLAHPGTDFAEALDDCGADFGGCAAHSATQFQLDVPASRLAPALALLAEAVTAPELAEDDVERVKAIRLAEIEAELAQPGRRASLAFRQAVVAGKFRASRPAGGRAADVAAVDAELVRAFHAAHYAPDAATLVLAGDFEEDPFGLVEDCFDAWPGGAASYQPQSPAPDAPRCVLIDRPGAVQAEVRMGAFGLDRGDPAYASLAVACHALGGAFLSRLNAVLREEKGYSYGVQLGNAPMRSGGLLSMRGSFRSDAAADAIAIAREILDISDAPITPAEVDDAVAYSRGVTPMVFATACGLADQVAGLVAAGLSAEWVDAINQATALVTPETATAALRAQLRPDKLTLVVVGDAETLHGPLSAAGWDVG